MLFKDFHEAKEERKGPAKQLKQKKRKIVALKYSMELYEATNKLTTFVTSDWLLVTFII